MYANSKLYSKLITKSVYVTFSKVGWKYSKQEGILLIWCKSLLTNCGERGNRTQLDNNSRHYLSQTNKPGTRGRLTEGLQIDGLTDVLAG